jgi:hypothetical protein
MPGPTLEAFADHGQVTGDTITGSYDARQFLDQLAAAGIDFDDVTEHLEHEGLAKFEKAGANWARPSQPSWTASSTIAPGGNEQQPIPSSRPSPKRRHPHYECHLNMRSHCEHS